MRFYSGCRARIHTIYGSEAPTEIFGSGKHSHPATELEIERRVAVNSMRDAERAGRGTSTRHIIANASQLLSENGKQQIQNMPTLSRNVQHWRQAALGIPALPPLRTGYEIPDSFKFTKDGDLFLAYDSGVNDADRILMFATESGLNDLAAGAIWACDGTFQVSPNLWTQLFTILDLPLRVLKRVTKLTVEGQTGGQSEAHIVMQFGKNIFVFLEKNCFL